MKTLAGLVIVFLIVICVVGVVDVMRQINKIK